MAMSTNAKLSVVTPPAWRPYPGLSLLYDPPGCATLSGVEPLERLTTTRHRDDRLARRLLLVAEDIAAAVRRERVQVGLVPWRTYHVTLCDGVNEGNRTHVRADRRDEVDATLAGLPDSLAWSSRVLRLLRASELAWSVWTDPVTFGVEGVSVWGHALVARLAPADARSLTAAARHEAARVDFVAALNAHVGVQTQEWRPHVTLGYFGDQDDASLARDLLGPSWQDTVRERTGDVTVTFRSAAVYGFTDMVSFWRLGHR